MPDKIRKTDAEWRLQMTPEQFRVARQKGTERPFSGEYWDKTEAGTYRCVGCGTPLFESSTKFDAGCGWPSFYKPVAEENVAEQVDSAFGIQRTEVVCLFALARGVRPFCMVVS